MKPTAQAIITGLLAITLNGCATGTVVQDVGQDAPPDPTPIHFGVHAAGAAKNVSSLNSEATRHLIQWDQIEPSRGLYRFKKVARGLNELTSRGVDVSVTLRCNSQWACSFDYGNATRNYDRKSSAPKDWQDWRNFVTKIVESFDGDGVDDYPGLKGAVKAWQVDNEFAIQWKGTGDELIELMRVTYEAIKAADPEAIVITPGFFPVSRWALRDGVNTRGWVYTGSTDERREKLKSEDFGRTRAKGHKWGLKIFKEAGAYFDAVDIHIYASNFDDMRFQVEWVQQQFKANGLIGKEIWALEFASPFHEFDERKFNRHVIQMQVAGFAQGLDRIYWSSVLPTRKHPMNFQRLSLRVNPRMPKTASYNYALTAEQLTGFTEAARVESEADTTIYRFDFGDTGKTVWVGWKDIPEDGEGNNDEGSLTTFEIETEIDLTEIGMVQPGKKKPEPKEVVVPEDGQATIILDYDPVFVVQKK